MADVLEAVSALSTQKLNKTGVELHAVEVSPTPSPAPEDQSRFLVVSPYVQQPHLLDLEILDEENQLLARALTSFEKIREDYATALFIESFNWTQIIARLRDLAREDGHKWKETSFYIVAFRSQIPPTTVRAELGALDQAAHAEATASGGFLKYWFGIPDADGQNLATCVWRHQNDAKKGGVGPAHRRAAGATRALYSRWRIEQYRLIVKDDISSWEIVKWAD